MPITIYSGANLKKLKKDELMFHIVELYKFVELFDGESIVKLKQENQRLKRREKQNETDILKLFKENKTLKQENERLKRKEKSTNTLNLIELWIKENLKYSEKETTSFSELIQGYTLWLDCAFGKSMKLNVQEVKEHLVLYQRDCPLGWKDSINGTFTNPKINVTIKENDD